MCKIQGPLVLVAILVVAALILVNAVYVAAEFAAVSVRRSRIQQLAADGNPLAAWLLPVLESPGRARPLHRRLPDRHHALEPGPRRLRAGDARRLADAVLRATRRACRRCRAVHIHRRRPARAHGRAGHLRRAGSEVAGAAVSDSDGALHAAARWCRRCGSTARSSSG